MTSRAISILLLTLLVPQASFADDDTFGEPGFYAAVQFTTGTPTRFGDLGQSLAPSLGVSDTGRSDTAIGVSGRAGWRIIRRLAVEAQVDWLDGFDYIVDNNVRPITSWTLVATANARGYLIVDGKFQPFLTTGFGYMQSDLTIQGVPAPSVGGFVARVGGGFDAYITRHIGVLLTVEYLVGAGGVNISDHVTAAIGAFYHF